MTMRPQDRIRFDNLLEEARYASHANDHQKAYTLALEAAHLQWTEVQAANREQETPAGTGAQLRTA